MIFFLDKLFYFHSQSNLTFMTTMQNTLIYWRVEDSVITFWKEEDGVPPGVSQWKEDEGCWDENQKLAFTILTPLNAHKWSSKDILFK